MKLTCLCLGFLALISFAHSEENEDFQWDYENHPQNMVENYTTKFSELPTEGEILNRPWSGDYWPTQKGGISYRWYVKNQIPEDSIQRFGYDILNMKQYEKDLKNKKHLIVQKTKLDFIKEFGPREGQKKFKEYIKTAPKGVISPSELSPAEKYDLLIGDKNWSLTRWERERTDIMKLVDAIKVDPKTNREDIIESWWGLCHAWAPATILYKNPGPIGLSDPKTGKALPIKLKNPSGIEVPFGSSDIKALLSIHFDIAESIPNTETFLGSRCNLDMENYFQKLARGEISEEELFEFLEKNSCNDTNAGSFHITLANLIGHYKSGFIMDHDRGSEVWNQGVVSYKVIEQKEKEVPLDLKMTVSKIISIVNEVTWVTEIHQKWEKVILEGRNGLQISSYKYDLYLDHSGNIIGGKWIEKKNNSGKSWKDRPDFLWMRPKVSFKRSLPGLQKIYNFSQGKVEIFNAKKMWKKTSRKIINAQKFIKNTRDLTKERKKEKENYIESLKLKSIMAFKSKVEDMKKKNKKIKEKFGGLLSKARRNIFKKTREVIKKRRHLEKKGDKVLCHTFYYTDAKQNYRDFKGLSKSISSACEISLKNCNRYKKSNKIRDNTEFCLKGRSQDYLYTCDYTLYANPDPIRWFIKKIKRGRKMGTFSHKAFIEKLACQTPKEKCQKRVFWNRSCKKEVKRPFIKL